MVGSQTFSYKIERIWGREFENQGGAESSWESDSCS